MKAHPAVAWLTPFLLSACAHQSSAANDPHVKASSLPEAAQICADRGFSYVARTAPEIYYCLSTNPDDEPEAIPIEQALRSSP